MGAEPCAVASELATPLADVSFERDIQPILERKCIGCHGTTTRQGELDLETIDGIRQGGESGLILPSVGPQTAKGILYEYIRDRHMPPEDAPALTEHERDKLLAWMAAGASLPVPPPRDHAMTQQDILPILRLRCTVCHGTRVQEAGLDLRTRQSLLRGGTSGPAIVPGDPDASLLVQRVHASEMPPLEKLAAFSIKPMTASELEKVRGWIAAGAPEESIEVDEATTSPDPLVTDADREFWAFQKPRRPSFPPVLFRQEVCTPVDLFIEVELEGIGLQLSPAVDRRTLLRRLYFDLWGLPPDPAAIREFENDPNPNAYELVVDRLLASPHYGERWAQYWLDLAGYSDSEGVQNSDLVRPHAYRYRDYVIRAFNSNKPYDRFLVEQLAGDELQDYESAPAITPEIYDNLVATGFLRMTPDGTFAGITGFVPDRLEIIDDALEVLSSSVMGLTIKCARCHSHKFDPIPQRDYYRLAAIFKGALDEHDWLVPTRQDSEPGQKDRYLPYVLSEELARWEQAGAKPEQRPLVRALWDRGEPSMAHVLQRGDYLSLGRPVGPGVPSVLTDGRTPFDCQPPWPGAKKTGRRLAFARWLVSEDHPLTARVMVNRIWLHHFGRALVATPDNFGTTGARPTHPALLDWLATEFVASGWDVKQLHRILVNSAVYRQTSAPTPDRLQKDPENRYWSRMELRRLDGESLRDTLLSVSDRLDLQMFGPASGVNASADGLVLSAPSVAGDGPRWRRSIYVLKRRTEPLSILANFDVPGMTPNCVLRTESIVAPQALHLLNDAQVRLWAESFAERVAGEVGDAPEKQVRRAFALACGRDPSAEELAASVSALEKLTAQQLSAVSEEDARKGALVDFCHTLMNSAALMYVD
jgi:hypothetical protein